MKNCIPLLFTTFLIIFKSLTCELLGVIQVNRHGARTGNNFDDLTSFLFFGSTDAQLTINGYKQQEQLGQWIAERYMFLDYPLLKKDFDKEEIIIKASPKERTIFSAVGFVKGLYPNSEIIPIFKQNQERDKKMKQNDVPPIPNFKLRLNKPQIQIIITDPDNDKVFHADDCKIDSSSNETVKDLFISNNLFNFTQTEINKTVNEIISLWPEVIAEQDKMDIYNKKFLKTLNGFIRPTQYHFDGNFFNLSESTSILLNKIQIEKWYGKRITDSTALKLVVSGFFDEFINYMDIFKRRTTDKINNKLKYVVYSGHDGSIISILVNILTQQKILSMIHEVEKYYDFLQPQFASHFIIELHSEYTSANIFLPNLPQLFIRIIYNGIYITEGFKEEIVFNKEANGIEFNSFINYLRSRIDSRFEKLYCKRKEKDIIYFLKYFNI